MAILLKNKEEMDTFFSNYDPENDDSLIINYGNDTAMVVKRGDYVRFEDRYIPYMGNVSNPKDIDQDITCLYRIGKRLYRHRCIERKLDLENIKSLDRKIEDRSEVLDIKIRENDNILMIICKELLKGMRTNTFKQLVMDKLKKNSPSDFNNIKKELTYGTNGNFSWNRFTFILDVLGYDYVLGVVKRDGSVIGANLDKIKENDNICDIRNIENDENESESDIESDEDCEEFEIE